MTAGYDNAGAFRGASFTSATSPAPGSAPATRAGAAHYERVDDEWPFVETLCHLIFATDAWAPRMVLDEPMPFHRLGKACAPEMVNAADRVPREDERLRT